MDAFGTPERYCGLMDFARALAAIGSLLILSACAPQVEVSCDQLEVPVEGKFAMGFTVTNRGRATATELDLEIHDTGLQGEPMGPNARYALTGHFAPGTTPKLWREDVPAPPNFRMLKFSKLDCTLERVRY